MCFLNYGENIRIFLRIFEHFLNTISMESNFHNKKEQLSTRHLGQGGINVGLHVLMYSVNPGIQLFIGVYVFFLLTICFILKRSVRS